MRGKYYRAVLPFILVVTMLVSSVSSYAALTDMATEGDGVTSERMDDVSMGADDQLDGDTNEESDEDAASETGDTDATPTDESVGTNRSGKKKVSSTVSSGEQTMQTYYIEWIEGSSKTNINASEGSEYNDSMEQTPSSWNQNSYSNNYSGEYVDSILRVNFSMGGEEVVPAGKITIRIPRHIYYDRDNNPIGEAYVPLPVAPQTGGETGFHYSIDEETDEIVITNFREIAGAYFFKTDIKYQKAKKYEIKNGYENAITAQFEVELEDGSKLSEESNEASLKVNTSIGSPSIRKTFDKKFEKWQSAWGEEPADADDYFYVRWKISTGSSMNTQPYTYELKDDLGGQGEIVGYYFNATNSIYNNWDNTFYKVDSSSLPDLPDTHILISPDNQTNRKPRMNEQGVTSGTTTVVVRYNREEIAKTNGTVSNTGTFTVKGIDDGEKTVRSKASYTYVPVDYRYKGDEFAAYKYDSDLVKLGINKLLDDKDVDLNNFSIRMEDRGWGQTEDGTKSYTSRLDDQYVYLEGERLNPEDYSITSYGIYFYDRGVYLDPENGLTGEVRTDDDGVKIYEPVEIWVRSVSNPEWHRMAIATKRDNVTTITYEDGTEISLKDALNAKLPTSEDDIYAISFRHTGAVYDYYMQGGLRIRLHPTEHVKSLIEDKSLATITNVLSAYRENEDGTITIKSGGLGSYIGNAIQQDVKNSDLAEYGREVVHSAATAKIDRFKPTDSLTKTVYSSPTQDNIHSLSKVSFRLKQVTEFPITADYSMEALLESGAVKELREGTFYDLLPRGTYVDESSIQVGGPQFYSKEYIDKDFSEYATIEYVDNWEDTGRTMMIIRIELPENENCYWHSESSASMGFTVFYDVIYPWDNIMDFGGDVVNSAAFHSTGETFVDGLEDDGGRLTKDKEWMTDLDGSGQIGDTNSQFLYAQTEVKFKPVMASELAFRKSVKTPEDKVYSSSTTALENGTYTYRLRFANGTTTQASDVIFYDILEEARPTEDRWKGTFQSIDVSVLKTKGINPDVYYSTYEGFKGMEAIGFVDLTNTELWSKEKPSDSSKITAVAIDMTKDTKGEKYIFEPEETASVFITMKVPEDITPYVDKEGTDEDETIYAYNSAYLSATTIHKNGGGTSKTVAEECNSVEVNLRKPESSIHKQSNPASGTAAAPTVVKVGDTIDYELIVGNEEESLTLNDFVVEDEIPDGLVPSIDKIQYRVESEGNTRHDVAGSDLVSLENAGNKLTFTIRKIAAGDKIHLYIPTTVDAKASQGMKFINGAVLKSINGKDQDEESEKTYHKTKMTLTAKKKWDDRDNAFDTRSERITVELYADEVATGKTAELSEDNDWSAEFKDLEKWREDGETEIVYTAQEVDVPDGYTPSVDGVEVKNSTTFEEDGEVTFHIKKYRSKPSDSKIPEPRKWVDKSDWTVVSGAEFALTDESGAVKYTAVTDENGVATFTVKPPVDQETYTLTLSETSVPDGYVKTDETCKVIFTKGEDPSVTLKEDKSAFTVIWSWIVGTDLDGSWRAFDNYDEETKTLDVYNEYEAEGAWVPEATKLLEGRDLSDGEFRFTVTEDDKVVSTGTNKSDGTIVFEPIEYKIDTLEKVNDTGIHHYVITEERGNADRVTYSEASYEVDVEVSDNNDGTLTVTPSYPESGVVFVNTYEKPDEDDDSDEDADNEDSNDTKSEEPATGDESNLLMWVFLLIASAGILTTTAIYRRRR